MIQEATEEKTKRCSNCLRRQPLEEFRLAKCGSLARRSQCNQCHRLRELKRYRHNVRKHRGMQIQKASAAICQATDPERVAGIAEGLLDEFGGWERFVRVWRETFEAARKNQRHRRVFHMLASTWKLQQAADELAVESRRVEFDRVSFELSVVKSPTVAANVLTRLGWTIAPPAYES